MKLLIVLFISFPAFACKLLPEASLKGEETAAINAVKKKTSAMHVKAKVEKGLWLVRTTKPSCLEFTVKTKRHANCKVEADILSERPCP